MNVRDMIAALGVCMGAMGIAVLTTGTPHDGVIHVNRGPYLAVVGMILFSFYFGLFLGRTGKR